ncbi:UDP-glucose dehydrogenase family protein [Rhizobium sp. SL42]|uniref:UDP-glucose dehydrogenase family protein n=1 Tax=Rhizobium sp. SL42 TaxID=2806346 RepID=UPI001F45839B|nr:UDP-glucose/GDP-mannose dehydrogenase family protein [Rhizobium sp. SL42]UJW75325.1 UDP-glucose/GDP-mannose dehydrogenase family protein [Rhizobium sp. SL42]
MNVTIFGTGYVGLVTGACLADVGHNVMCMDIDQGKIDRLNKGEIPIYEPGLQAIVERNIKDGTLLFTTDAARAVAHADMQFVAVGTPPDESGAADLQYVLSVAETIGRTMAGFKLVVVKSTVPVGTCDKVAERLKTVLGARTNAPAFEVVSNPEFLKEGAAVSDFLKPDRIIVGTDSAKARTMMAELYEPFNRNHERTIYMDRRSSELTKYAANAMLATKISFINEIANLAEKLGADIEHVRRGIGADPRIGYHFIYPGIGYGGSCFPKDVQALARTAREVGYDAHLIEAVEAVNNRQKHRLFDKIAGHFGGERNLAGKTVAIWGLSFKPNTDDMREASSRVLMESLWSAGARIRAFDPVAGEEAARLYGSRPDMVLVKDKYSALDGADALAVCTEWQQFRAPDFGEMALRMQAKTIFDGRNLFAPERLRDDGWTYLSIGRAPALPRLHAVEQAR